MSSLDDIIDSPAGIEIKRALAVKMILYNFKTDIGQLLQRKLEFCILANVKARCIEIFYVNAVSF